MINSKFSEQINGKLANKFDIDTQTGNITLKTKIAKQLGLPKFEMVFVQGGKFIMGDNNGLDSEKPEHEVELSSFYIAKFQLTQELYEAVIKKNPSSFKGKNRPVERVNWYESVEFCQKLNERLKLPQPITGNNDDAKLDLTKTGFRLPTEAEWEYAAVGTGRDLPLQQRYQYAGSNNAHQVAWFTENSNETKPVGLKLPNSLGIYDMSGNVWEWCWDCYDADFYKKSPKKNPQATSKGSGRVLRGGSWFRNAYDCRAANRNSFTLNGRNYGIGLRLGFGFQFIK